MSIQLNQGQNYIVTQDGYEMSVTFTGTRVYRGEIYLDFEVTEDNFEFSVTMASLPQYEISLP
jgi:hypothetical protein